MTEKQCERAWRKLYERITRGYGYQPFGFDWRTMDILHPGFRVARNRLREEVLKYRELIATGVQHG